MSPAVHAALDTYIDEPSPGNFVRLQVAVAASPEYHPHVDMADLTPLMDMGKFDQAMEQLVSYMPNRVLNPGIHKLLSLVQHKRGDKEAAHSEYTLAMLFMEGLLSTGDGTEARPYVVLHVEDEHDILGHLGKSLKSAERVNREEAVYQRAVCEDGSEVWFNVSSLY